jgi:hypothetical protein
MWIAAVQTLGMRVGPARAVGQFEFVGRTGYGHSQLFHERLKL